MRRSSVPAAGALFSWLGSRVYPLYILLFLFDFSYTGLTARSACEQIGAPDEHWLGLAFYLTLTQSWFYAVICRASLAYQYGPVDAVSWSISVEVSFCLVYVLVAMLIAAQMVAARSDRTPWSRLFSHAIPARLGEVSYSIYLLHELIPSAFKRLGLMTTDIAVAWVTWAA